MGRFVEVKKDVLEKMSIKRLKSYRKSLLDTRPHEYDGDTSAIDRWPKEELQQLDNQITLVNTTLANSQLAQRTTRWAEGTKRHECRRK